MKRKEKVAERRRGQESKTKIVTSKHLINKMGQLRKNSPSNLFQL